MEQTSYLEKLAPKTQKFSPVPKLVSQGREVRSLTIKLGSMLLFPVVKELAYGEMELP